MQFLVEKYTTSDEEELNYLYMIIDDEYVFATELSSTDKEDIQDEINSFYEDENNKIEYFRNSEILLSYEQICNDENIDNEGEDDYGDEYE